MKRLLSLLLLLLCIHLYSQEKKPANYKEAIQLIDLWMNGIRDFHKLPGISIAIVDDQQLVWKKAYGFSNVESKTPAETNTIYSICSISKLFTSIAIMQLWEAGKLRLDDSVTAVLPSFDLKQQFSGSGPITIRSLLTHSSGLPRESDHPYWSAPDFNFPTEKQVNDRLKNQQTLYPASTYYQYSNLGLTILGEIVAKLSGMSYENYVEQNILKPLRLSDTHPWLPKELWGTRMAKGYSSLYRDGTRKQFSLFDAKGITAAAGFSSSVEDLALFMEWQFRLLNENKTEILKSSTLKEMQRVHWLDPDWKVSRGLGFSISRTNEITYVGHGGSCPGYVTQVLTIPAAKLGVTVMINGQGESPSLYCNSILNILRKVKEGNVSADSLKLDDYSGYYDGYAWGGETIVVPWQGNLLMTGNPVDNPADERALFKPVGKDLFRRIRSDKTLGDELRFERDTNGKLIRMWVHNNYQNKIK
jgi:CubicO group peptidase (beta-lactamase class C family)